jgi:hypothetical protein
VISTVFAQKRQHFPFTVSKFLLGHAGLELPEQRIESVAGGMIYRQIIWQCVSRHFR